MQPLCTHPTCPAPVLYCICPSLYLTCPASILYFIRPVLHLSCPACDPFCNRTVLCLFFSAPVRSCIRVEWFTTFCIFGNGHIAADQVYLMSSIYKKTVNFVGRLLVARAAKLTCSASVLYSNVTDQHLYCTASILSCIWHVLIYLRGMVRVM